MFHLAEHSWPRKTHKIVKKKRSHLHLHRKCSFGHTDQVSLLIFVLRSFADICQSEQLIHQKQTCRIYSKNFHRKGYGSYLVGVLRGDLPCTFLSASSPLKLLCQLRCCIMPSASTIVSAQTASRPSTRRSDRKLHNDIVVFMVQQCLL